MENLHERSRLARCLVLGLGIAAIAVPVAQASLKSLADFPPAVAREAAKSYGPLPAAPIKTLTDYPAAVAAEAAKSYGPLPAAPIKTLTDYPAAVAAEAAKSYGPLPAADQGLFYAPNPLHKHWAPEE